MAKLYVVPTPVGNLEDMTFRAISVLREVDCILAEDTRTSGILLKHFDIHTRMQSHHKFNEHQTIEGIVSRIEGGENIALISDAGTPAISDPGFLLVRISVSSAQNAHSIQRNFRGRKSGIGKSWNFQNTRRNRTGNNRRIDNSFLGTRTERRNRRYYSRSSRQTQREKKGKVP